MFEFVFGKKHVSGQLKTADDDGQDVLLTVFPAGLDAVGMRGMIQVFMRRVRAF